MDDVGTSTLGLPAFVSIRGDGAVATVVQGTISNGPVINATGVILHTNLGRAPLAPEAVEHLVEAATRYSNLEYDLERGELRFAAHSPLYGNTSFPYQPRRLVGGTDEPMDACKKLTDAANAAGGHDNVTVIVAFYKTQD